MNPGESSALGAVPGYEQVVYLRRGGTATLYSGRRSDDGGTVVLKVFDSDQTSAADRQWSVAKRLDGVPGALPVLDRLSLEDGRTVVVIPYVAGGSLADHSTRFGPMPDSEVARIGASLASTLQGSHDAGILHRDLKPSNVLLGEDGSPILSDFDAATSMDIATATETMAITLLYAAPEVLEGATADARSDVYSLGLTLQAAAVGSAPFADTNLIGLAPLVNLICSAGPPDPSDHGVGEALAGVLRRATALDPTDRYRTAAELRDALQGVADSGDGTHGPSTGADVGHDPGRGNPPSTGRGSARRSRVLTAVTAVLSIMAIGAVLLWNSSRSDRPERITATADDDAPAMASVEADPGLTTTIAVDDPREQVTDGNGVLGPLFVVDDFTYQGRISRECERSERWVAFSIHADQDDRVADIREPWLAVGGEQAGTFMAYLPCENGGRDIRFVLRAPGRWFVAVAAFPQDQYDRMVAWMRENETSPAPDYTVDDEIRETLADQTNYLGFDIIDRTE